MATEHPEQPRVEDDFVPLRPGAVRKINHTFARAGVKALKEVGDRNFDTYFRKEQTDVDGDVRARILALFDAHYPFHREHDSKDNIWKRATAAGFIAGMRVNYYLPCFKVRVKYTNAATINHMVQLGEDAERGYDLRHTLVEGQLRDPLRRTAVDLLPEKYVEGYADAGYSLFERDKRDLYVAALGYTAQIGLGALLQGVYREEQAGVGFFEARRMKQELKHGINSLGGVLATEPGYGGEPS